MEWVLWIYLAGIVGILTCAVWWCSKDFKSGAILDSHDIVSYWSAVFLLCIFWPIIAAVVVLAVVCDLPKSILERLKDKH